MKIKCENPSIIVNPNLENFLHHALEVKSPLKNIYVKCIGAYWSPSEFRRRFSPKKIISILITSKTILSFLMTASVYLSILSCPVESVYYVVNVTLLIYNSVRCVNLSILKLPRYL